MTHNLCSYIYKNKITKHEQIHTSKCTFLFFYLALSPHHRKMVIIFFLRSINLIHTQYQNNGDSFTHKIGWNYPPYECFIITSQFHCLCLFCTSYNLLYFFLYSSVWKLYPFENIYVLGRFYFSTNVDRWIPNSAIGLSFTIFCSIDFQTIFFFMKTFSSYINTLYCKIIIQRLFSFIHKTHPLLYNICYYILYSTRRIIW